MRARSAWIAALLTAALWVAAGAGASQAALPSRAATAAHAFLKGYLLPEGRVVRTDQGGDTVSGGEAQAMLVEVALGERAAFAKTWEWTRRNLQGPDGLLASEWNAGHVVDAQPASDADVDTARALLLAAQRFHVRAYRRAALRIAGAVLTHETFVRHGTRILLAGPWAAGSGTVAPGYWSPRTFEMLRAATHDRRWAQLEQGAIALARKLVLAPARLPPEWASVATSGAIAAAAPPPPHPASPIEYSFVAARLPIRFAEACTSSARSIAADVWPFFQKLTPSSIGFAYSPTGTLLNPDQATITLLGAAAAAQADRQPAARDALLTEAEAVNARFPTYYGSAWLALTEIELAGSTIGSCS